MRTQTTDIIARLSKVFGTSMTPRVAALAMVALMAAVIGPPGLAVGPTQSRTATPALPTGAAMEARVVLATFPISTDIVQASSRLTREHASYPEQTVGALRFPQGAIDVPWAQAAALRMAEATGRSNRGGNVSTPLAETGPRVIQTSSTRNRAAARSNAGALNDLRTVVIFDRTGSDLTGNAYEMLDQVAQTLSGNDRRVQLLAYGGSIAERSHAARRLALRRALAVRNHLMEHGINQNRITVRAMGGATDGGPSDRVDVVYPAD